MTHSSLSILVAFKHSCMLHDTLRKSHDQWMSEFCVLYLVRAKIIYTTSNMVIKYILLQTLFTKRSKCSDKLIVT